MRWESDEITKSLSRVVVSEGNSRVRADSFASGSKDRILAVTAYGTYPVPDPAEDEKTLDARVDLIVEKEARLTATRKVLVPA